MKNLLKFFGTLSPAHILLFTISKHGKKIGTDSYGNVYYEASASKGYSNTRRWVFYQNEPEASKIPPEWHGWLHHQTDVVPDQEKTSYRRVWQKPHHQNMTGTNQAYRPDGPLSKSRKRKKLCGDYEPWKPQ